MSSKTFSLGQILSITTGILLCRDGIEGVYDILNYLTSDNLYTNQLPRAAKETKPYILEQLPALAGITKESLSHVTGTNYETVLAALEAKHGSTFELFPMHSEDHAVIDPVTELINMGVDPSRIIKFEVSDDPPSPHGDIDWKVE